MLNLSELKKLIDQPKNRKAIERGKYHEDWLKFHNLSVLRREELAQHYREMCWFIDEMLPDGKAERWKQMFPLPVATLELTETIFTQLSKVFDAEDAFVDIQDGDEFFDLVKQYQYFFRTEGWTAVKRRIDAVLVIDFPREQVGAMPEPYLYLVDVKQLIDIDNDSDNNCQYVIFRSGDDFICIDDANYWILDSNKRLKKQIPHLFGETPARSFWSDFLTDNYVNHLSPITKSLSELDWLLIHKVNKRYLDMGNSFPIMAAYKRDAVFGDTEEDREKQTNEGKDLLGPGTLFQATLPISRDDVDLLSHPPVQIIAPDIGSLDYNVREEERKTELIYKSTVGIKGEPDNEQAKNEKQIESGFESQVSILRRIASNLEKIETWTYNMIGKIYNGQDYEGATVSYGKKFFVSTVKDISLLIEDAKRSGNLGLIDQYQRQVVSKYKGRDQQRQKIMNALDPLPSCSVAEAKELFKDGVIDKEDVLIKTKLLSLVARFERENTNIIDFGSGIDFSAKVSNIDKAIRSYIKSRDDESKQESEL